MAIGTGTAIAIGVGGTLLGGYLANKSAGEAAEADREAQAQSNAQFRADAERARKAAGNHIGQGSRKAERELEHNQALGREFAANRRDSLADLSDEFGFSQDTLAGGLDQARGDLQGGLQSFEGAFGQAQGQLGQGFDQARTDLNSVLGLQGLAGQATNAIGAADVSGHQGQRLGNQLDEGLFSGFEQDPGFQFRQEQGERAINAAASARGGRNSGRTLKELAGFNSGLASQEFQNFSQRRQAEAGLQAADDAQRNALLQNQASRMDHANLAAQQNAMGLAGMGFGAQGQLSNLAAQQGQGLAGLSQALGQGQLGAGGQLAGLSQSGAQSLADLIGQQGMQFGQFDMGTLGQQIGMQTDNNNAMAALFERTGNNLAGVEQIGLTQQPIASQGPGIAAQGNAQQQMLQNMIMLGMMGTGG